ncbi:MAG: IS630 family transposase [Parafilimonas sp.]
MQRKFVAKLKRLRKRCIGNKDALIFFDPMHQVHNSKTDYAWQFKGNKGTKEVKTNTGRRRINIIGGINILTMKATTLITEDNCDKKKIVDFLRKLRKGTKKTRKIYLVLDNARYNHAAEVKAAAIKLNIELVYLPAYCPNLNLIERLWKYTKKEIIKNKFYQYFEEFQSAIEQFFSNLEYQLDELISLLQFNFGIIKAT